MKKIKILLSENLSNFSVDGDKQNYWNLSWNNLFNIISQNLVNFNILNNNKKEIFDNILKKYNWSNFFLYNLEKDKNIQDLQLNLWKMSDKINWKIIKYNLFSKVFFNNNKCYFYNNIYNVLLNKWKDIKTWLIEIK